MLFRDEGVLLEWDSKLVVVAVWMFVESWLFAELDPSSKLIVEWQHSVVVDLQYL